MYVKKFLKDNWVYLIMVIFIITVSIYALALVNTSQKEGRIEKGEKLTEMFNRDDMQARQEKINALMREDPSKYLLLVAANFFFLFLLTAGFAINIYMFVKWRKKSNIIIRTQEDQEIKWNIDDILKFISLIWAFAFILSFFQRGDFSDGIFANKNFMFIYNAVIIDIVGILFVLNFVFILYGQGPGSLGITGKNFFKNALYGIAAYCACLPLLFLALFSVFTVVSIFKLTPEVQPVVDMFIKEDKLKPLVYLSFLAAVLGPVMEEIVFRGFMYKAFRKKMSVFWSVIITAFIFSLLHMHAAGFLPIMILGVALALLYEKTGSIVAPIFLHVTHNMLSLLIVFIIKGLGLN